MQARVAQAFADEVAAERAPSVRAIRARLHVGQSRAQRVRAYLAVLAAAGTRISAWAHALDIQLDQVCRQVTIAMDVLKTS